MTDDTARKKSVPAKAPTARDGDRQARTAAALRENLRKRKAQLRARAQGDVRAPHSDDDSRAPS